MLTLALSRSTNKLKLKGPSPPPNSPLFANSVDTDSEVDDDGDNDKIDFSRLRAELDRLLDEGCKPEDEAFNEVHVYKAIDLCHPAKQSGMRIEIQSAERLSRSV
ncbi:uncharacterized protein PHALS_07565 [Plasmopara halstedii]|uniref:Uncharacterized protein n=1 Tax=Plasmopara halstedii TaxID=4781 RepID=A0A0P1B7J1_PLAHL|nr:uncharacterized protein PHALS_07565 [Plasmopara halstedii]CEG49823.1 hypothetical protein PHALS_07565 [Plasmopara halstedii]|eukprot:XP_024586192.1 hypothetical protein PHALS_07565 [Plasmopara halstedii]